MVRPAKKRRTKSADEEEMQADESSSSVLGAETTKVIEWLAILLQKHCYCTFLFLIQFLKIIFFHHIVLTINDLLTLSVYYFIFL